MPWIFTSSGRQSFLVANNRRYPLTAQLFREYEADRVPVRNVSAPTWLRWQAIYPAAKHP